MTVTSSTLGDVADFINGAAFKPEDWGDEGAKIIRIQNLTDQTKPYNRTTRVVNERIHVQPGDLLVSWSATLGVFEWVGPDVAYLNQHIFRVVPYERKIDKRYLRHALELALLDMRKHLHGATMLHVNRGEFLSTRLYLPSIPEQRRIAAILDKADVLRTKRREASAQLDRLAEAIFVKMFGDPEAQPGGRNTAPLSSVTTRITDGTHLTPKFLDSGVPFIFVKNFQDGIIDFRTDKYISDEEYDDLYLRCPVEQGDILYTTVGATYGKAVAVGGFTRFAFQRHVAHLKPDRKQVVPEFLEAVMQLPFVKRQADRWARGAAQPTINLTELRQFYIPLPNIDSQLDFVSRMTVVKKMKFKTENSAEGFLNLFASLQNLAFRGEL